jgi:MFS family permease
VCDDNWKPAVGQSLFYVGSVIGSLGFGIMADHIGRLPVLVLANVLALLGNVATAFTYNLTDFAASRLLAGLATDTNFFMMYIIGKTGDWNRMYSETRRKKNSLLPLRSLLILSFH